MGHSEGRWKLIIAAGLFPLVCLCWGGAVFVLLEIVNGVFLQRDFESGNTLHAPLSKNYQIRNTKTQSGFGLTAKEDATDEVQTI